MSEILETSKDGRHRVRLVRDEDPVNPRRDYENLCHVITVPGSLFIDVDEDGGPLQHGWDHFHDRYDTGRDTNLFIRWARIYHGAVAVEHRPHDGPRSLWYLLPADIEKIGNTPQEAIEGEIREYRAWAEGDVWGYVIERIVDWDRRDGEGSMTTWEHVDSCWGFIGYEYAEQEAKEQFAAHLEDD